MTAALLLCLLTASQALEDAQKAYDELRYDAAEALVYKGLSEPLAEADVVTAYELLVVIQLTAGREAKARDAFVALLQRVPGYAPKESVSPKIWAVYRDARERVLAQQATILTPTAGTPPEPPAPLVAAARWYQNPWVWTAIGVVVGGIASYGVYRYANPSAPASEFPVVPLR